MEMEWTDLEVGDGLKIRENLLEDSSPCCRCLRLGRQYIYHISRVKFLDSGHMLITFEERKGKSYHDSFNITVNKDGIILCPGCGDADASPVFEIMYLSEE